MQSSRNESLYRPSIPAVFLACLLCLPIFAIADDAPDYMQPILMYDPTLNNSFSLQPEWNHARGQRELSVGWELDKAISSKLQIAFGSSWATENAVGVGNKNGLTNSELSLGYVFYQLPEFQAMLVPDVSLHNGLGISEPQTAGLAAAAGGRLAMYNEDFSISPLLQAIQFNIDLGSNFALGTGSNDVYADAQIAYSLPYLEFATKTPLPAMVRQLNPFFMVNYDQPVGGSEISTPSIYLTPGVAFQADAYQISTALQLPMNSTASSSQQIGVTAAFILYLDKIDPLLGRTLF